MNIFTNGLPTRQSLVTLHRWAGLTLAPFVFLAAVTGAILAFYHELDHWMNPDLYEVNPSAQRLTALQQYDEAKRYAADYGGEISRLPLQQEQQTEHPPANSTLFYVRGSDEMDQLFINPYSGEVLGHRTLGDLSQGIGNLPGFIYLLHRKLAIPGTLGATLLGLVALVWTLDCLIALWIAAPARPSKGRSRTVSTQPRKTGWQRWKRVLTVRRKGKKMGQMFDWHRAGGIWAWLFLLMFAWSSVGLNLNSVFQTVMSPLGYHNPYDHLPGSNPDRDRTGDMNMAEALDQARQLLPRLEQDFSVTVNGEGTLDYLANRGMYRYRINTNRDLSADLPRTQIFLDARSGERLHVSFPTGQHAGNTIARWLYALHLGQVFGVAYQVVLAVVGGFTAFLVYTGVWLWWQRRKQRASASRSPRSRRRGSPA